MQNPGVRLSLLSAVGFAFLIPSSQGDEPRADKQPAEPALLFTLKGHTREANRVAFSPDGTRLASAGGDGDATVNVWDTQSAALLLTLTGHERGVYNVAFSPDGKYLASVGTDMIVRVWNAAEGKEIVAWKGHTENVTGVAFSPDGKRLASSGRDRTVRIWKMPD